jgi:hypothetical protein
VGNGPGQRVWVLGGWGDGDVEAEGLELAEVGADLAVAVGFAMVPAGSEVGEPGFGAGEQMPGDDEDGAGDGALGPVPAEALGQAAGSFAEEGVGAGGTGSGLGAVALEVGVALAFLRLSVPGPGLAGDRGEPGPGDQVVRGGEPGHVQAGFGDDSRGELAADARDLREPVRGRQGRGARPGTGGRDAVSADSPGGGDRVQGGFDLVLDRGTDRSRNVMWSRWIYVLA